MYSFNVKADSLLQLGHRLAEASKMFLAEQVFVDNKQTNFDFDQTKFPKKELDAHQINAAFGHTMPTEEVSNISVSDLRAQAEIKKERKPRTTKPKQVNSSPVMPLAETPAVISTTVDVSANVFTREVLTAKLNAFLEHPNGGIQAARDLLKTFGAAKMSDISDDKIEEVIKSINAVMENV